MLNIQHDYLEKKFFIMYEIVQENVRQLTSYFWIGWGA
jgi:hypothetical protein